MPLPLVTSTWPGSPPVIITLPILPKFALDNTDRLTTPKLEVFALLLTCNVPNILTPVVVIFTIFGELRTLNRIFPYPDGGSESITTLLPPSTSCLAVPIFDNEVPSPTK